jgi:hypothetical protein
MSPKLRTGMTGGVSVAAALFLWVGAATAEVAPNGSEIPASVEMGHSDTVAHLEALGHRPGRVGSLARDTLVVFRQHIGREDAYIKPPLTLLPYLTDGKVTPEMRWAIPMAERLRADRDVILQEHNQINTLLTELRNAGRLVHDREAVDFAVTGAVESLDDMEIQEPTVLLIGAFLKLRLQPEK